MPGAAPGAAGPSGSICAARTGHLHFLPHLLLPPLTLPLSEITFQANKSTYGLVRKIQGLGRFIRHREGSWAKVLELQIPVWGEFFAKI